MNRIAGNGQHLHVACLVQLYILACAVPVAQLNGVLNLTSHAALESDVGDGSDEDDECEFVMATCPQWTVDTDDCSD